MVKGTAVVTSILIAASLLFSAETESNTEEDIKAEFKTDEEMYEERVPADTKTEAGGKSLKKSDRDISITVFDLFTTFKADNEIALSLSDRIRTELTNTGIFTVMERDAVKEILSQHEFLYADTCRSPSCMTDIGHCIGVHRIVYGSIASVNNYYNVVLRLLNVPRGEIISTVMADLEGDSEKAVSKEVKTLVKKLMAKGEHTTAELSEQEETGILHIDADRYKSDIAIDGKTYTERTPYTFNSFPAGKHWIVVSDEDGAGAKEINLEPDDSLAVFISLCDKKDTVHISSSPAKAKVIIDGKEHGKTPLTASLWVGSHQVEVMKNNYITQKLIVTVDSSGDNTVEVDLKGKATLSVVAKPDFAHVYINGSYAGKGKVDAYTVEAGDVEIRIEAPEYTLFKTTEKIELGKTKTVKKELECLFGSLEVNSKPDKVSLFLNDVEVGTTPYRQSGLRTGKYTLTLLEDNHNRITEEVVIQPGEVLKRNYTLKYTKAYKDSLRRERWIAHGAQGLRRALFCALGAACGAAGYYFEMKLRDNVENYSYWEDEYDNVEDTDQIRFKEIKENYYRERNQAKTNRSNRNVFIGVAGVCGAGFCISIFF